MAIKEEIGQPEIPRDQHVSQPDSYMALCPRPSAEQSQAPSEVKSLEDTNENSECYYNVGFDKEKSGNDYEEFYYEIGNPNLTGM